MRLLRRLEAEWRRKRSWRELMVIVVFVQMVIFVTMLFSWSPPQGPELPDEEMQRVGDFFLFFPTPPNLKEDPSNVESGQVPEEEERVLRKPWVQNQSASVEEEFDDPVLGRGFQDEFVTFKANGEMLQESEGMVQGEEDIVIPESHSGEDKNSPENGNNAKVTSIMVSEEKINLETAVPKIFNKHLETTSREKVLENVNTVDDREASESSVKGIIYRNVYNFTSLNREYKFKNYNMNKPVEYILGNDTRTYFVEVNGKTCFAEGTKVEEMQPKDKKCRCHKHYYGQDCGIPEAAWYGRYKDLYPDTNLRRRLVPRRIINGLPVNHEFAMFEARMYELYDVVDVFLVAESNYTAHGDAKELEFFQRFQRGYMADFQDKVVYIHLGFFSQDAQTSGWVADAYLRYYMGIKGLPLLQGLHHDDLFVLSDADEIPTREILTFLKLYNGYPEPVAFGLRWNVFSFAWKMPADETFWNWLSGSKEKLTVVNSAATVGMLQRVLLNNTFYIRKQDAWKNKKLTESLERYQNEGHLVKDWTAGTIGHYAGWHCSWCFSPESIIKKMDSAQANDTPRWGDYPEKKNIDYITSRLWRGKWFDDKLQLVRVKNPGQRFYAPKYLLDHPELYRSILFHPGHERNLNRAWRPP